MYHTCVYIVVLKGKGRCIKATLRNLLVQPDFINLFNRYTSNKVGVEIWKFVCSKSGTLKMIIKESVSSF